jgi:hypothetical protein
MFSEPKIKDKTKNMATLWCPNETEVSYRHILMAAATRAYRLSDGSNIPIDLILRFAGLAGFRRPCNFLAQIGKRQSFPGWFGLLGNI